MPDDSTKHRNFTWLPKATGWRITLALLLAAIYFDKATHNAGYATIFSIFMITLVRYGWFFYTQSPRPDLRKDWWRNPGIVSAVAIVINAHVSVNADREAVRNSARGSSAASSSSYSSSDEDARLRRNFERGMGEETTSRNDRPTYRFPDVGSCSSCGRRGTITTGSGYTIACPDCGGRGYRTDGGGSPKVFPKYGQ